MRERRFLFPLWGLCIFVWAPSAFAQDPPDIGKLAGLVRWGGVISLS